jgi:hypothetical protein
MSALPTPICWRSGRTDSGPMARTGVLADVTAGAWDVADRFACEGDGY